jgi:hypothetical protein
MRRHQKAGDQQQQGKGAMNHRQADQSNGSGTRLRRRRADVRDGRSQDHILCLEANVSSMPAFGERPA